MRLLLHIGTDKTGTTAIQQHLYLNRTWLDDKGIYLPRQGLGTNNGHAALFEAENRESMAALAEELMEAERRGYRQAVLSWEGLCLYGRRRIKQLRGALPIEQLVVLVYLREQADIVQSGYLQQLKSLTHRLPLSAFESPKSPLQRLRSRRARMHPSRNYFRLLERWRRGLQPTDLVVRFFDRGLLHHGDVIDDFLLQFAVQADAKFVRVSGAANVSLDVETATLIERWSQQGLSQDLIERRIDASLSLLASSAGGEKYFLSAGAVDDIRDHYRRSNQLLAQHYLSEPIHAIEVQKDCWSQLEPGELAERADQREATIASIAEMPVHSGPLLSGAGIAAGVALLSGWQIGESWGWWSEGDCSQLRLRIPFQQLLPMHVGIRLYIKGRYYAGNEKSRVTVNGLALGEHHLSHQHAGLYVKIADLLPQQLLEIELTHEQPVSPRQFEQIDDDRQLAFGIESIGYDLVALNNTTEEEI